MRTLISSDIRKTAAFLHFASKLTFEKIQEIMDDLAVIAKDNKNFSEGAHPLTLSPQGMKKIKRIEPSISKNNLLDVLKKIDDAIIAGAIENSNLEFLMTNIKNRLKKQGKWISVRLPRDLEGAQKVIIDYAIKPLQTLMEQILLTPEVPSSEMHKTKKHMTEKELKEMQKGPEDLAVPSHFAPGYEPPPEFKKS